MSIVTESDSIKDLENTVEKMILESKTEILESSLSSTISLFGSIGSVVALFIVVLIFWLNWTVKKKLVQIESVHKDISIKEHNILLIEKGINEKYEKAELINSNINDLLSIGDNVRDLNIILHRVRIYWKVYIETQRVIEEINTEIGICEILFLELEEKKDQLIPRRNELLNEHKISFIDLKKQYFYIEELDWDFDEFCFKYFERKESLGYEEILNNYDLYEKLSDVCFVLRGVVPDLERIKNSIREN